MFYAGLHQPADSVHFERAFISVNRVRGRRKPVPVSDWILDSGAFRELEGFGGYRHEPAEYAAEVNRLALINPGLRVAVSQDWMCEPFMLAKTGLDVAEHQRLTIERYDALLPLVNIYLMPVLQGYLLQSIRSHRGIRRPAQARHAGRRRLDLQAQREYAPDRGHPVSDQAQAARFAAAWFWHQDHCARQRRGARLPP